MANLDALKAELLKPSVLKEGHLLKLGRSVLKLPKLNYYVLKPSGVYCFKGKQENEEVRSFIPLEEISLSLGTVVESNNQLYCIKITDRRKLRVLACHSIDIRNSWMTAILTAVAQRLVNEPHFLRRRADSTCTSPDVFYDPQCQFTSPFWVSQQNKRKSRAEKSPMAEAVSTKTGWSRRKKSLPTSLSFGEIEGILNRAQQKPKMTRKRSMQDLSRYFFGPNSNKPSCIEEDEKVDQIVSHKGKRRWSLFTDMASALNSSWNGSPLGSPLRARKHEVFYEQESSLIWDTKL